MISVSEKIIRQIQDDCIKNFQGIFPKKTDFAKVAHDFVNYNRSVEELNRFSTLTGCDLANKTLLEIGSGYGLNLAVARKKFGAFAFGVEPSGQFAGTFQTSQHILEENGIPVDIVRQGTGEKLPHDDASFDLVYSNNVLEHVQNPQQVLGEALRVLKPKGWLYFSFPNYGSCWEGHYGVFFPPHCPKWLFKILVRFLGRSPEFIDSLQFITYKKLQQWLKPHRNKIWIKTYGQELFIERLHTLEFSDWAFLGKLKKGVLFIRSLGLIRLVSFIGKKWHWETPFVLVIQKLPDLHQKIGSPSSPIDKIKG